MAISDLDIPVRTGNETTAGQAGADLLKVTAKAKELVVGVNGLSQTVAALPGPYTDAQAVAANAQALATASAADRSRANHTGTQTAGTISDFTEAVQDAVAGLLGAGSNIVLTYDDANNSFTISGAAAGTSFDPEATRDAIGAALIGVGNIGVAINDAGDTITISTTATANSTDAQLRDRSTHNGTQSADTLTDGTTNKVYTASEKTKLAGIATGATANSADATLLSRANHTGTQPATTISDFTESVQDVVAGLLGAGSNITLTYDDANNTFTIAAAAGASFDPEATRDAIGAALIGVGVISVAINDAADTITISSVATQNSTDAFLLNADNHTDGTTNKVYTAAERAQIAANTAALPNKVDKVAGKSLVLDTEIARLATLSSTVTARNNFGLIIRAFTAANKFDNLGAALSATPLAIHSSGSGLVSSTPGTDADGYVKLPREMSLDNRGRAGVPLTIDTTASGENITVALGNAANGAVVTISIGASGSVSATVLGTTVTGTLSGTVNMWVDFATGNQTLTPSVHLLGAPAALAVGNPWRTPIYGSSTGYLPNLAHIYLKTNATSSRIMGLLHNATSWDGDPQGLLLGRTMLINPAGIPGDHDSYIIVPDRADPSVALKSALFFHQKDGLLTANINAATGTAGDAGETARQLLAAGYALLATNGGAAATYLTETNWWGNPMGLNRSHEVYTALTEGIRNTGKLYLIGWSMGGVCALNYLRAFPGLVGAVYLSCPVVDLEETGTNSVQGTTSLKSSLDTAYAAWYYSLIASNAAVPATDDGTSWRQVSDPGGLPHPGYLAPAKTTATSASPPNLTLASNVGYLPGDIFLKRAGKGVRLRSFNQGNTTIVGISPSLATSDVTSGEPVGILGTRGYDSAWVGRSNLVYAASTQGQYTFQKQYGANVVNNYRPHNPMRFADYYAALGVAIRIRTAGARSANDGILNNEPMYAFADAVNAKAAGLVVITAGTGGHIATDSMSATDTLSWFATR
jgi:hypothetical protein